MLEKLSIHWFRQDLRLQDNPGLNHASQGHKVLPIYIVDEKNSGKFAPGAASNWWLYNSLVALNKSLKNKLSVYKGDPLAVIMHLVKKYKVCQITWNRCYEPWSIKRDQLIKEYLTAKHIKVHSFNSTLLWEPWEVLKADGTPYKVFTAFYRTGCLAKKKPRAPIPKPFRITLMQDTSSSLTLEDLELLPKIPWHMQLAKYWKFGEVNARKTLERFIQDRIQNYQAGRNYPAKKCISNLSPHLHFGEISPHQVWSAVQELAIDDNVDHFCSELGWREFSYNLLYYNPDLPQKNLQKKFDLFPWYKNNRLLQAWQHGRTGIPMVDAGMRELWQTGFMHNRVRMIVGSFLVKNLNIHWKHGERWFWDCLVDADLANNSAGWQWIAGSGADAAPYFRIFNPVTQGQKFDPEGIYIRKYVPELSKLPNKYLFAPWQTPGDVLKKFNIILGTTYPMPIVDLQQSRQNALTNFRTTTELWNANQ